jgi:superfamily II DNA helicase RecQ
MRYGQKQNVESYHPFYKAKGKSGIIYCLSRKKSGGIAQVLQVNGISAVPYHAGLDAKTRARHQDMFHGGCRCSCSDKLLGCGN